MLAILLTLSACTAMSCSYMHRADYPSLIRRSNVSHQLERAALASSRSTKSVANRQTCVQLQNTLQEGSGACKKLLLLDFYLLIAVLQISF